MTLSGYTSPNSKQVNNPLGTRTSQKIFLLILALGFACRVIACFFSSLRHIHTDSQDYFSQANALLGGGYINFFPNGYPLIVASIRRLAGGAALNALLWMNILMSTAVIYFVYDISLRVFRRQQIALVSALIVAFFPSQINYARWLMTEVPTTFFMAGAFWLYYRNRWFGAGLFLGAATLVRTEILPVMVLLLLADLFFKKRFNFLLLTGSLIPLLALGYYCYTKTGEFSLAGHGKFNVMASVTASGSYVDWHYSEKHPEYDTKAKAIGLYFETFKKQPLSFIGNRLANLWELWGFYASDTVMGRSVFVRFVIGMGNLFLILFGGWGWWMNRKNFDASILMIPFLVITCVHIVFFAMQRYTYPVEPFMIILAGWPLSRFVARLVPEQWRTKN